MNHLSLLQNSLFMPLAISAPYIVLGYIAATLISNTCRVNHFRGLCLKHPLIPAEQGALEQLTLSFCPGANNE